MAHIQISALIPGPRTEVFDLLTDPAGLKSLLCDHIEVEDINVAQPMKRGAEYEFMMTRFGISQNVKLRVEDWLRGSRLVYRQIDGSFANWSHTIKFEDHGERQTLVTDLVEYDLPLGILGHLANDLFLRRDMKQILRDRLERAKDKFL